MNGAGRASGDPNQAALVRLFISALRAPASSAPPAAGVAYSPAPLLSAVEGMKMAQPNDVKAITRNDALAFARYTRSNLECIESAKAGGNPNVHQVTQLMLSLLGLIVFPWATPFRESVESRPLEDVKGGVRWQMNRGARETLGKFGKHPRNAVAHRRVHFSSDSSTYHKVDITFEDINWCATINAAHLRTFCLDLTKLLEDEHS
jgi:HEPN pEK499 p136